MGVYSRAFHCCVMGVYIFHCRVMGVYIVTGVPLLGDKDVYTHVCSTALGLVCTCHIEQP